MSRSPRVDSASLCAVQVTKWVRLCVCLLLTCSWPVLIWRAFNNSWGGWEEPGSKPACTALKQPFQASTDDMREIDGCSWHRQTYQHFITNSSLSMNMTRLCSLTHLWHQWGMNRPQVFAEKATSPKALWTDSCCRQIWGSELTLQSFWF